MSAEKKSRLALRSEIHSFDEKFERGNTEVQERTTRLTDSESGRNKVSGSSINSILLPTTPRVQTDSASGCPSTPVHGPRNENVAFILSLIHI